LTNKISADHLKNFSVHNMNSHAILTTEGLSVN